MKNKHIAILFLITAILTSCVHKKAVYENITGFIQGSTYNIVYENKKKSDPAELKVRIEKILHDFDKSLSIYDDSSILSKINRNEEVVVDSFFTDVFNKSVQISKMTDGAFDITVAPLVKAWGFGPDDHKNFQVSKLDSLMRLIGMNKLSLINGKLVKTDPRISLDFNAIAQGYSVDVVSRFFERIGVMNYLVEIGGEVMAKGTKNGALWRIGIDRPEDYNMAPGQDLQAIIKLKNKAISTSGNYRKFYVEDGIKYSHTINPKTGYPAKNRILSASIVADECGIADGIATACMVKGLEGAIELIKKNPQLSAYFIYSDDDGNFKTWISEDLKDSISETVNQ